MQKSLAPIHETFNSLREHLDNTNDPVVRKDKVLLMRTYAMAAAGLGIVTAITGIDLGLHGILQGMQILNQDNLLKQIEDGAISFGEIGLTGVLGATSLASFVTFGELHKTSKALRQTAE